MSDISLTAEQDLADSLPKELLTSIQNNIASDCNEDEGCKYAAKHVAAQSCRADGCICLSEV